MHVCIGNCANTYTLLFDATSLSHVNFSEYKYCPMPYTSIDIRRNMYMYVYAIHVYIYMYTLYTKF